jgi:hypothetical protein
MILGPALRLALAAALAGTLGLRSAHADIYTWVDASGSINVSNLTPPDDVRMIRVMHENPRPAATDPAADDPARQAQALAARVKQLEREVELSKRAPPPRRITRPRRHAPMPGALGAIQRNTSSRLRRRPSSTSTPPATIHRRTTTGAIPLGNCGFGWNPGFYPSGVVVLQQPNFRRNRPSPHGRPFVPHAAPSTPAPDRARSNRCPRRWFRRWPCPAPERELPQGLKHGRRQSSGASGLGAGKSQGFKQPRRKAMLRRPGFSLHSFAAIAGVASCIALQPASAQTIVDEWASVQAPPPPALKPVTVDRNRYRAADARLQLSDLQATQAAAPLPFRRSKPC